MVVEKDESRRFIAKMQGFEVVDLERIVDADIVVTCVGAKEVLTEKNVDFIRDGAILCNMSAVTDEIKFDLPSRKIDFVDKYEVNSKKFYVVAKGYAINLALGYGTAIEVMDRTFSAAIYALEYIMKEDFEGLIELPIEIEKKVLGL